MKNLRLIKQIIEPSTFSILATFLLSAAVLTVFSLNNNEQTGFLFQKIFGDDYIRQINSLNEASFLLDTQIFGSAGLNELLFFVFWMFVGLSVYYLVSSIISSLGAVSETVALSKRHDPLSETTLKTRVKGFVFSVLAVIAAAVYATFFINIFLPFSLLTTQLGLSQLPEPQSFLWLLLSMLVLWLSLHIVVVCIRLILRRTRVWGFPDDVYTAQHSFINR